MVDLFETLRKNLVNFADRQRKINVIINCHECRQGAKVIQSEEGDFVCQGCGAIIKADSNVKTFT